MPEPNYTIAGVKSPEDTIRDLVKSFTGYQMPNIPATSLRGMLSPSTVMSNAGEVHVPGTQRMLSQFQQDDQARAQQNAQRIRTQLNLQQMEHDRVKRDLTQRGLL